MHRREQELWFKLTAGAFRNPFTAWNTPPPIAPIVKAPPQSSTILQGLQEGIKGDDGEQEQNLNLFQREKKSRLIHIRI